MSKKINVIIAASNWYLELSPEEKKRVDEKYLSIEAIDTPAMIMKDGKELIEYIYEQEVLNANKENI